ncbi:AbgT family transporter, partial [Rhizobium ruizarguesonis]
GNLLPDPFWLFVILAGVVLVASWIGSAIGMRAENPSTGEIIEVQNLLTGEGFREMIANAIDNFLSFPPLGVILVVM